MIKIILILILKLMSKIISKIILKLISKFIDSKKLLLKYYILLRCDILNNYSKVNYSNINYDIDNNTLRLNNLKIIEIPNYIYNLSYITTLELSYNNIKIIQPEIVYLKNLINLDFSHNNIKNLPAFLFSMKKLLYISLAYNKINKIPNIDFKSNIEEINLFCNNIKRISNNISNFHCLNKLDVNKNNLNNISLNICKLPKLEAFYSDIILIFNGIDLPMKINIKISLIKNYKKYKIYRNYICVNTVKFLNLKVLLLSFEFK